MGQNVSVKREKKVSEAVAPAGGKQKEGVGEFIAKTRAELDKTTFPGSEEVKNTTIIVIVNVLFFAVFLYLADIFWVYILQGLTWAINSIAGI